MTTQVAVLTPAEIAAIAEKAYQAGLSAQMGETWNAKQVATFLKRSPGTVYTMAANGEIPCRKVGKKYFFNPATVAAWAGGEIKK